MPEWLQNPVVIFALAIGAMFFGYFFGLFEGRGQGYKRRQEEEAEKKENEPTPEPLPPASPAIPPDETPILDVSADRSGQLHLTLDGQRTDPSTLEADQRKRLIEVLTLMRPWLETSKPASSQKGATPPPQPKPVQSPKGAPSSQEASPPPPPSPSPRPSSAPAAESRPPVSPSANSEDEPAAAPDSIVAQIDSILQSQIAGTPLIEKGIRLQESPEGGVIVWVGMSKFQGVEDVPDEQIKAAIRAAISVWESKFTPGL
jgi:hypothetical protein